MKLEHGDFELVHLSMYIWQEATKDHQKLREALWKASVIAQSVNSLPAVQES